MYEKTFVDDIKNSLLRDIEKKEAEDVIKELFNEKREMVYEVIKNNTKMVEIERRIRKQEELLIKEYGRSEKTLRNIEEYLDAINDREELCNELMYKLGLYDGITIIINGIRHIDIDKYINENA